jgi:hypothetical protein
MVLRSLLPLSDITRTQHIRDQPSQQGATDSDRKELEIAEVSVSVTQKTRHRTTALSSSFKTESSHLRMLQSLLRDGLFSVSVRKVRKHSACVDQVDFSNLAFFVPSDFLSFAVVQKHPIIDLNGKRRGVCLQ